jgi:hypothetical protein
MKISVTHYEKTHTFEANQDDLPIGEVLEAMKGLLVSMGFHPHNVDEHFNTEFQWFTEAEQNLCQAWKDMQIDESLASESRAYESHVQEERDKLVEEYQNNLYKEDIDIEALNKNKFEGNK